MAVGVALQLVFLVIGLVALARTEPGSATDTQLLGPMSFMWVERLGPPNGPTAAGGSVTFGWHLLVLPAVLAAVGGLIGFFTSRRAKGGATPPQSRPAATPARTREARVGLKQPGPRAARSP
jgi:hypothetical protein